jgi:hypothetical protein
MGTCRATGNFNALNMSMQDAGVSFDGVLETVEFFHSGRDGPANSSRGDVSICSTVWNAARWSDAATLPKNGPWISVFREEGKLGYGIIVAIRADLFSLFSRMAEMHLGKDMQFSLSFPYPDFGDEGASSSEKFYAGEQMSCDGAEVQLSFSARNNRSR